MNLDYDILLWINGHGCEWLDALMWGISRSKTWIPLYMLLVVLIGVADFGGVRSSCGNERLDLQRHLKTSGLPASADA